METKAVRFALVLLLTFLSFTTASRDYSRASIVYTRGQLLALRNNAVLPHASPDVPQEVRKKTQGTRADGQERDAIYLSSLP